MGAAGGAGSRQPGSASSPERCTVADAPPVTGPGAVILPDCAKAFACDAHAQPRASPRATRVDPALALGDCAGARDGRAPHRRVGASSSSRRFLRAASELSLSGMKLRAPFSLAAPSVSSLPFAVCTHRAAATRGRRSCSRAA